MAGTDLIVHPSIVLSPDDILTADKLNLLGTPVVELAIADTSISDQNFCRNGNFYSSFWTTATGISCPVGVRTTNASYWQVLPTGGTSFTTTGTTASTIHITAIPSTTGMLVGMQVVGPGIPAGATIATVVSATAIDLSVAATASATGVALTVGNMVVFLRSTAVPDTDSLFSAEIQGNTGVTNVRFSQDIQGDLAATLRNPCTFSGYIYNGTGVTMSPQLIISSANAFNNFSARTDVSTTNLQSCPASQWTYVTDTVDLTSLSNIANGFSVVVSFGGTSTPVTNVMFSRLKFQAGTIATPFTDDVSLFVQAPSVDSTMLQDGCIARPGLFLQNVIPLGAYENQSITDPKIVTNTILARSLSTGNIVTTGNTNSTINVTGIPDTSAMAVGMPISGSGIPVGTTIASIVSGTAITLSAAATTSITGVTLTVTWGTSAVVGCLGYTPENKAGDTCTGIHIHNNDTVVNSSAGAASAVTVQMSAGNAANDGYMPAIGFNRSGRNDRAMGVDINGRFKTVDSNGTVGYLLDTVTGVDTNSYQHGSITLAALAQSLVNMIIPTGMIRMFGGAAIPSGWLHCDGEAISRTGYSALWAAIGTAWGAGDGANTFNLPNLQGCAPIGYLINPGTARPGLILRGFGNSNAFGEETHQLTIAELASHNHPITNDSHSHGVNQTPHSHTYVNPDGALAGIPPGGSGYTAAGGTQTSADNANINIAAAASGVQVAAAGSNGAHNNMQPFVVLYYIIKY
jgi:microcystin-dependent protein